MKKGTRVWTCDGCGKRETWRKGWSCWPCIESPANSVGGLLLPLAGCSEKCADEALERMVRSA